MEWGTVGEREGRLGGKGKGGRSVYKHLGPVWTGVAPHAKEGFQVNKRDLGTGEGSPGKGGIIKGIRQGVYACALILSTLYIHIILLCACG